MCFCKLIFSNKFGFILEISLFLYWWQWWDTNPRPRRDWNLLCKRNFTFITCGQSEVNQIVLKSMQVCGHCSLLCNSRMRFITFVPGWSVI